jgi:hypothetical protein
MIFYLGVRNVRQITNQNIKRMKGECICDED